jgi:hypothetical protein
MMKKIKTSILALLLSAASIQTGYATWADLPSEIKEYMLKMDGMTFKQLQDLALVDKASKAQVVNYFQRRLDRLNKIACPVITQEVFDKMKARQVGLPSFFAPARDPGYTTLIVTIKDARGNDIKWAIYANLTSLGGKNELQAEFQAVVRDITGTVVSSKPLGPIVKKMCLYSTTGDYRSAPPGRLTALLIYDEFLEFDELPLPQ